MDANQQVSMKSVPVSTLADMGFMSGSSDPVTPKQRDIFDMSSPIDKIGATELTRQLEEKAKETETPENTTQPEKPKVATPNLHSLESIADGIHKTITDAAKEADEQNTTETTTTQEPQSKEDKAAKNSLVSFIKGKIEKGDFQPYDDFDESKQKLNEYLNSMTNEQLEELADTNYKIRENKFQEEYKEGFFETLPKHLQYVVRNLADESVDPQSVYAALARVEHVKQLDPKDDNDQVGIVQSYLQTTDFGTPDEVAQQVEEWKEAGVLDKKAAQMKPKLDKLQEQQLQVYAEQAEQFKQQQVDAAEWYAQSVTDALKDGDLNGLKITRKQQKAIYDSLLLDVKPSVRNGQPLNGLWQALEKIQIVQPDFKLLSEITWHATDPQGYREFLIQQGRNEQQGKVTRELKTSQGTNQDLGQEPEPQRKKGIVKVRNPFDTVK